MKKGWLLVVLLLLLLPVMPLVTNTWAVDDDSKEIPGSETQLSDVTDEFDEILTEQDVLDDEDQDQLDEEEEEEEEEDDYFD